MTSPSPDEELSEGSVIDVSSDDIDRWLKHPVTRLLRARMLQVYVADTLQMCKIQDIEILRLATGGLKMLYRLLNLREELEKARADNLADVQTNMASRIMLRSLELELDEQDKELSDALTTTEPTEEEGEIDDIDA